MSMHCRFPVGKSVGPSDGYSSPSIAQKCPPLDLVLAYGSAGSRG
jgi:hypothetical protein